MSMQMRQQFYGHAHLVKIGLTMNRLLTVVNERKTLRNSYRKMIEDEYIDKKKAEEKEAIREDILARRERGEKTEMLEEEVVEHSRRINAKNKKQIKFMTEELMEKFSASTSRADGENDEEDAAETNRST